MDRDDILIDLGAVTEETRGGPEGTLDAAFTLIVPMGLSDD